MNKKTYGERLELLCKEAREDITHKLSFNPIIPLWINNDKATDEDEYNTLPTTMQYDKYDTVYTCKIIAVQQTKNSVRVIINNDDIPNPAHIGLHDLGVDILDVADFINDMPPEMMARNLMLYKPLK